MSRTVLLAEDNIIVALDVGDMLMGMGLTDVVMVHNLTDAQQALDTRRIDLAILDIQLGTRRSRTVALACAAARIPFILATGHGNGSNALNGFPPAPILLKPFGRRALAAALDEVLGGAAFADRR